MLVRGVDRLQQRPLEQELLAEEIAPGRLAVDSARRLEGLQVEHLARVVPLVDRRAGVQTLIALEPDQRRVEHRREHLGDFGFADAGFALEQERLAQPQSQEEGRRETAVGNVFLAAQGGFEFVDRVEVPTGMDRGECLAGCTKEFDLLKSGPAAPAYFSYGSIAEGDAGFAMIRHALLLSVARANGHTSQTAAG